MGPVSAGSLQPFASSFIAPWVHLCIPDYQLRLGVDPLSLCQAPDLTFTLLTYPFHHGQLSLKLYRGSCLIPSTSVVLPLSCSAVVCLGSSALPKSSSLMAPSHFVVPRVLLGLSNGSISFCCPLGFAWSIYQRSTYPFIDCATALRPGDLVGASCHVLPPCSLYYLLCGGSLCQHLPWSQLSLKLHIKMSIILCLLFNTVFNFF